MLTSGTVLLHDNARPRLLEHLNWELFDDRLYRLHLAPSYYYVFTYPINWLRSQHPNNNEELMEGT
jgi:hypothetical protein